MLLTKEKGRRLTERDYSRDVENRQGDAENRIKRGIPGVLKNASLLARELMWEVFNWRTKELERFVKDFKPDVIFAPCDTSYHVLKLALHVKSIAQCPMISYVVDDIYSYKRLRFYPSFWINKTITRKWIRRFFSECSLVYTMTEMQKNEYESIFKRPMKILCKSAEFEEQEKETGNPIRFLYAGNLYVNRWKTLIGLSDALAAVNASGLRAQLHIFSGTKLNARTLRKLNDGRNAIFHGLISYKELEKWYRRSDVAVFAESFDLKNRLITRLSFSTKIIDCLSSGCAVLAVGPGKQAGMAYLKDNDAAICVGDIRDLKPTIRRIVDHPELITEYSRKANQLGKKNHMRADIEQKLRQDFYEIASENERCFS